MKIIKRNSIYLIVVLFCLTFIVDGTFASPKGAEGKNLSQKDGEFIINGEEVIRINNTLPSDSPFLDSNPRINEEAAMINIEERVSTLSTFPQEVWIFLLLAFVSLLIFNLAYDFEKAQKIQWSWELGGLLLTLLIWFVFDKSRTNLWFPLYVIKLGLIIYLAYLYFLEKCKNIQDWGKKEKAGEDAIK